MKLKCTAGNPLAVKAVAAACLAGADLEVESVTGSGFVSALLSSYIYLDLWSLYTLLIFFRAGDVFDFSILDIKMMYYDDWCNVMDIECSLLRLRCAVIGHVCDRGHRSGTGQ